MEPRRDLIERTDFPSARKGYDPAAVDRHLTEVADAVDELRRAGGEAPPPAGGSAAGDELRRAGGEAPPPAAASAAEQVGRIVEAAERSAADIQAAARAEAARIETAAKAETATQIERIRVEADGMIERARAIERELDALVAAVGGLRAQIAPTHAPEPPEAAPQVPAPPPAEPAIVEGAAGAEGARLIALNMALKGAPREEAARYLRENFQLDDAEVLLDDVYARVGASS